MDSPPDPSGSSSESLPPPGFLGDRVLAGLILAFQVFWFGVGMVDVWSAWSKGPPGRPMFFDWIGDRGYGPQMATSVITLLYDLWLASAVLRGRGWAFVVLAFTSARWIVPWTGHFDQSSVSVRVYLVFYLIAFLYAGFRVFGRVGPRPADPLGLGRS